jgi:DNA repair protein SbcD/Mre11
MRILHTADWHIGKRLGRHDRMPEFREVLAEVERIAQEQRVDLVIVAGDVWDRAMPPVDALALGLEALQRLAAHAPVVAVAGNHDSPELFDALAPYLREQGKGVHLVGRIRGPRDGGMLGPDVLGVPAVVATFPFLREGRVVDFMRDAGEWYGAYAAKVGAITTAYNEALVEAAGDDAVPILVAHFLVNGVKVARGAPRGERELHMGDAYAATPQAIPAGPQYVAMGHIHAPQPVPSAAVPAHYAGSLLPLDFGEAGEEKRVVLVDVEPGTLATVTSIPLTSGRPLRRETGTWDELAARADELADAYLDLTVHVGGADVDLGRRAAEAFAYLVNVRALRPAAERRVRAVDERPTDDGLYAEYVLRTTGDEPPPELVTLFRDVLDEALDATA